MYRQYANKNYQSGPGSNDRGKYTLHSPVIQNWK